MPSVKFNLTTNISLKEKKAQVNMYNRRNFFCVFQASEGKREASE